MTDSGWVYVVIVLDWYTKKIVGHYSGTRATSGEWLKALEKGLNREFPGGVRGQGLKLMSDNGSQPTSLSFMKACSNLEVQQVFTSYNDPKFLQILMECLDRGMKIPDICEKLGVS